MRPRAAGKTAGGDHLEVLSVLGHELRRPLTVIRGAATLLIDMEGQLPPDKARQMLGLIDGNVEDMSDLIEDLLLMVHLEAGDLQLFEEAVEVAGLIGLAVAGERRHTAEHPITVLGAAPGLLVEADRDRAVRVLRAILANAARYSLAGTPIEIAVSSTPDAVRVEVRDRGPGFLAGEHERAFGRFTKLTGSSGLGLGLYLGRALVRQMGGETGAGARPGGGSGVWFTLKRRG